MFGMSVMLAVLGVLLFTAFLPVSSVPTPASPSFQSSKSQVEISYNPQSIVLPRGEEALPKVSSRPPKFTPSLPVSPPPLIMPKPPKVNQSNPQVPVIPSEEAQAGADTNAEAPVQVSQQDSIKPEGSANVLSLPSNQSTSERTSLSSPISDASNPQPQEEPKQAKDGTVIADVGAVVLGASSPTEDIANMFTGVGKAPEGQIPVKQDTKSSPSPQQDQQKVEVDPVGNDKSTEGSSDSDAGPKEEPSKEAPPDKVTGGSVPGNVNSEPISPGTSKPVEMGVPRKNSEGKTVASSVIKSTTTEKSIGVQNVAEQPMYSQGTSDEEDTNYGDDHNADNNLVGTGDFMNTGLENGGKFSDDEDSHFFAYFLTLMVTAIIFYLVFHNKQRIIALIIEGRAPHTRGRRNSSRAKYHKLDNNLEEAMSVTKGAKRH